MSICTNQKPSHEYMYQSKAKPWVYVPIKSQAMSICTNQKPSHEYMYQSKAMP
jgi:hypothetical protein